MRHAFIFLSGLLLVSCQPGVDPPTPQILQLSAVQVGTTALDLNDASKNLDIPVDQAIVFTFPVSLDTATVRQSIKLYSSADTVQVSFNYADDLRSVLLHPGNDLEYNTVYSILIKKSLRGKQNFAFPGITLGFTTKVGKLTIVSFKISGMDGTGNTPLQNVPLEPTIEIKFSVPIQVTSPDYLPALLSSSGSLISTQHEWSAGNSILTVIPSQPLDGLMLHHLTISSTIQGVKGEVYNDPGKTFYTVVDPTPKFPVISDDQLLTLVQQQTFKYFWDFAHPASGMARERDTSGNTVTTGGSGFGIMSIIVGIERNFITRTDGVARLAKIVSFLETADRFHGVWPHWINGNSGDVIPFSTKDNGGDLVESSFLVQGLITFRQYLQSPDTVGNNLINRINKLWTEVEWDWYRKNNENVLYWHWSPNYTWEMNFAMYGYFEEQITYFLAAASPTYAIPKIVYSNGYGRNGAIKTGNSYYNIPLPLGSPSPLFWVHYSYLGLDPHFSDDYANYWEQNVNATLINRAYCIANPKKFVGYSDQCWGLTSSDNQSGYGSHSPGNDLGVITPTAALSSFPYTPNESMTALKFFYYTMGDRLWGPYGFYDAFNTTQGWYGKTYLAIDQGPIIVMIENHRSGLLWNLFMSAPEVQTAKSTLGFTN